MECIVSQFEYAVIMDIKQNYGDNLQNIFEREYENGIDYSYNKSWILEIVFIPLCKKLLSQTEIIYLIENIVKNCADEDYFIEAMYQAIYKQIKLLRADRYRIQSSFNQQEENNNE